MGGRKGPEEPRPIREPEPEPIRPEPIIPVIREDLEPEREEPEKPSEPIVQPENEKPYYEMTGAELRGVVYTSYMEHKTKIDKLEEDRQKISDEMHTLTEQFDLKYKMLATPEERNAANNEYERKYSELTLKRKELYDAEEEEKRNWRAKARPFFFLKEPDIEGAKLKINIGKGTKLYKEYWKSHLEPQKEFLEKILKRSTSTREVEFHVKGVKGSGGTSYSNLKHVDIGMAAGVGTTPIHEFVHQAEKQLGITEKRQEFAKKFVEQRTGKKIEDVELKAWTWYTDSKGEEWKMNDVLVPVGFFKSKKEEEDFGYMFRVYYQGARTKTVEGEKKIFAKPDADMGQEFFSNAVEHLYKGPEKLIEHFPEVFDALVDTFRGM